MANWNSCCPLSKDFELFSFRRPSASRGSSLQNLKDFACPSEMQSSRIVPLATASQTPQCSIPQRTITAARSEDLNRIPRSGAQYVADIDAASPRGDCASPFPAQTPSLPSEL